MSATPIPRSLSFVLYGEIDVSIIKTKPKKGKKLLHLLLIQIKYDSLIDGIKRKIKTMNKFFGYYPSLEKKKMKMIEKQRSLDSNILIKFLKIMLPLFMEE